MYLQGKYIYDLVPDDIQNLFTYQVKEGTTLDYKRELDMLGPKKDSQKREFFSDLTAMYNTEGGIIIYGIEEHKDSDGKSGYPGKYFNQTFLNKDEIELQISQSVRSNTDPKITNLAIRFLEVEGNTLLIIGVPKCLGLPAMVTDLNKFFRRNNSGKYAVFTTELYQMFIQNQSVREKADSFRHERVKQIYNGLIPNVSVEGGLFVHTIPYNFLQETIYPINSLVNSDIKHKLFSLPLEPVQNQSMLAYNLDGIFTYKFINGQKRYDSYNQYFRNGIVEIFTNKSYYTDDPFYLLTGAQIVETIYKSLLNIIHIYKRLQIESPVLIYITLTEVGKARLVIPPTGRLGGNFTRSNISLPPVLLQTLDLSLGDLFNVLKPAFDIIWQAANVEECNRIEDFKPVLNIS